MMIKCFSEEKKKILDKLYNLNKKVNGIENSLNVDLNQVKGKIERGIENIKKEKFSLAFFGAFSDGKSTLLSALTHKLDIKITPGPTTDKVTTYSWGDYFIIDTPGLFSDNLMHDELTKKYISEANVILYTIDSVNPLKESHHSTIKWLIEDLDKINSTIFIINKMDEVSDLEDNKDFKINCNIKKKVVEHTLKEITFQKYQAKALCIAADPYEAGLPKWFKKNEEYKKLSRIDNVTKEIKLIISNKDKLILNAGFSIINESIVNIKRQLNEQKHVINEQIEILDNQIKEIKNRLDTLGKDIRRNYINIKEEIINQREEIIEGIIASKDLKDIAFLINAKIGGDGYILKENINITIMKYTNILKDEENKHIESIEKSLEYNRGNQDMLVKSFAKLGAKFGEEILSKSSRTLGDVVLKFRDISKLPIKFKPWGALKWGNRIKGFGKVLKGLPLITESLYITMKYYNEKKLKNETNKLINEIEFIFRTFIESFTIEEYIDTYFISIQKMNIARNTLLDSKAKNIEVEETIDKVIMELEKIKS